MAGIYIHIPFCKSRCIYCDFFSTTSLDRRKDYVDALIREWQQRKAETSDPIRTIYLGGGTPSLLDICDLQRLLSVLPVRTADEVTLECNPGDITPEKVSAWRAMGINRLSMGVQSFCDPLLRHIGRRHTAKQARLAVKTAQSAGFDNISIDLIYALPMPADTDTATALQVVQNDVEEALQLNIQHISTYCLTFEDDTPLSRMLLRGEVVETDEDTENTMYDWIASRLAQAGFEHYEVSNFALPSRRSQHNSNYWNNTPYIGLGAGAHSYDGQNRSWNPDDLSLYINGIQTDSLVRTVEHLSDTDRYNEMLLLGLRTSDGIPFAALHSPAKAVPYIRRSLLRIIIPNTFSNLPNTPSNAPIAPPSDTSDIPSLSAIPSNARLVATQSGWHILNTIIEDLME
ncbi:MAG: radical SAM family heme chaperone HemW [Paludibacteraceae bacterium]|nr:radical SAM family heme chaperone HemW [Paludibacteraceae bacterium]